MSLPNTLQLFQSVLFDTATSTYSSSGLVTMATYAGKLTWSGTGLVEPMESDDFIISYYLTLLTTISSNLNVYKKNQLK